MSYNGKVISLKEDQKVLLESLLGKSEPQEGTLLKDLEQERRKHEYERLQYTYMLSRINERMKK